MKTEANTMLYAKKDWTETEVFRICVLLGCIGLMVVYGSSLYIELEQTPVSEIKQSWTGKNVMISGEVTNYRKSSNNVFFDLEDGNSSIKVVMFDTQESFENGEAVNVTGHVAIYQNQLEVIARDIET